MPESLATLLKKDSVAQVFSYIFCEISKNIFFREHLRTTASALKRCFQDKTFLLKNIHDVVFQ